MPRISYLDFSADDPVRAVNFYSNVFGWQINRWDGPKEYWEIKTGESDESGIDGGLSKRERIDESNGRCNRCHMERNRIRSGKEDFYSNLHN